MKLMNDKIIRIDSSYADTTGYFRGSDGKLNIYPVPTADDVIAGLEIKYLIPFTRHAADTENVYVDAPYEKMYYEYLIAKMHCFSKDYASYNNWADMFNGTFGEYIDFLASKNPFEKDDTKWNLLKQKAAQELLKKIKM